jgi:hypothetical protein
MPKTSGFASTAMHVLIEAHDLSVSVHLASVVTLIKDQQADRLLWRACNQHKRREEELSKCSMALVVEAIADPPLLNCMDRLSQHEYAVVTFIPVRFIDVHACGLRRWQQIEPKRGLHNAVKYLVVLTSRDRKPSPLCSHCTTGSGVMANTSCRYSTASQPMYSNTWH